MSIPLSQPLRHTFDGTLWGFLAEATILPTGLITAIYLTRSLGPEGYGLFTLAATLIGLAGFGITSLFSRATIKFVSEADDWRPVGATVLRVNLACGLGVMLLLWLAATPIAVLLGEPELSLYIKLFAFEPLLFIVASAYRSILIGVGRFRAQALPRAVRWLVRLLLIVILVEMGLSIFGAILGSIGAALVELFIYRCYIRPGALAPSSFPARRLWGYAGPLFLSVLCFQVFSKIDLFALTALGGTAAQAGIYGAAQNLSIIPGLFAMSFSPLLLATLGRMLSSGQVGDARMIGREAMRMAVCLLPFAGMAAGAAYEVVVVIYGPVFSPAAPVLALLITGKMAMVMVSIVTVIVLAADRPRWAFVLAGPMLLLAVVGHALLIPRLGAIGAAMVTSTLEWLGALLSLVAVYRVWRISPPRGTVLRSVLLSGLAYAMAAAWSSPDLWLIPELLVIMAMIPLGFWLLGEFDRAEIAAVGAFVRGYASRKAG